MRGTKAFIAKHRDALAWRGEAAMTMLRQIAFATAVVTAWSVAQAADGERR